MNYKRVFLAIMLNFMIIINGISYASVDVPSRVKIKMPNGTISKIDFDEYLYGVVSSEMPTSYTSNGKTYETDIEALRAQAVVSRTYALYNINANKYDGYDLTASTSDQVYKFGSVKDIVREAVDSTSGEVITYDGEVIDAFFSASSGGYTEASENVWSSALPYLKAVADPYEVENKNTTWEVTLTADEIEDKLLAKGVDIGNVTNVEIIDTSDSGRVTLVRITGSKVDKKTGEYKFVEYKNNNARTIFGLKSQWYTINDDAPVVPKQKTTKKTKPVEEEPEEIIEVKKELKPLLKAFTDIIRGNEVDLTQINSQYYAVKNATNTYTFRGRGYGHAVGMSQYGAIGMAENGFDYEEIIKWYYTGVKITK